ncbi:hypothetical protein NMY22_g8756 [Coprinellus aureogranulatus]|nr:hypothetical protein NMY22_g8756 [Coprinellus aureogranulatus]
MGYHADETQVLGEANATQFPVILAGYHPEHRVPTHISPVVVPLYLYSTYPVATFNSTYSPQQVQSPPPQYLQRPPQSHTTAQSGRRREEAETMSYDALLSSPHSPVHSDYSTRTRVHSPPMTLDVPRPPPHQAAPPDTTLASRPENELNIYRIEIGNDQRTSIVLKNIPSMVRRRDLVNYIAEASACIAADQTYRSPSPTLLGRNCGYAFVNFIDTSALSEFLKEKLGKEWHGKILQACYATRQGKRALVKEFRDSPVMEQPEVFRPMVFHSSGPKQGLPEPFPYRSGVGSRARRHQRRR